MRILHLEFGKNLYGGTLQVAYLLSHLSRYPGIESHLACPDNSDLLEQLPDDGSIHLHPIKISGESDFGVYFRLKGILKSVRPDLLHIHSRRGADLWGILLARRHKLPHILTRRVDNPDVRFLMRWRSARAFRVVGISRKICDVLQETGVPEERVECILSRVDTEAYQPGKDRSYLENLPGIQPDHAVIGMIAQLIERKGHRVLLKALPEVLETHPETKVLIFGKGPMQRELQSELEKAPWGRQVQLMGFRDDLDEIIPCLDMVVHPAYMEGLGVSLLQAASCGVPIIGSRAGGIPEIVRHGENGFLIEPGDSEALARYMNRLIGDPDLRKGLGMRGREIAKKDFSISGMASAYAELYAKALEKQGSRHHGISVSNGKYYLTAGRE